MCWHPEVGCGDFFYVLLCHLVALCSNVVVIYPRKVGPEIEAFLPEKVEVCYTMTVL